MNLEFLTPYIEIFTNLLWIGLIIYIIRRDRKYEMKQIYFMNYARQFKQAAQKCLDELLEVKQQQDERRVQQGKASGEDLTKEGIHIVTGSVEDAEKILGKLFHLPDREDVEEIVKSFEKTHKTPFNTIKNMGLDEFYDWLDDGTIEEVKQCRRVLAEESKTEWVYKIDAYLKIREKRKN